MVDYLRYLAAAQMPGDAIAEGMMQGLQIRQGQQQLAANRELMQQRAAKANLERQAQERMVQEQENFSNFLRAGRHSLDEYMQFAADNPFMRKQALNDFSVREQADKDQIMRDGFQWFSALRNDRPDLVVAQAREKAEALENAGNNRDAALYGQIAEYAERDPKVAEDFLGQNLAFINPDFAKITRGAPTTGQERLIQQLQEEAIAKGKPISTQDALMQLRGFTPERLEFEKKKAGLTQSAKSQADLTYEPQIEKQVQSVRAASKKIEGLDKQINTVTGELAEFESKFPSLAENLQEAQSLVNQLPFGVIEEAAQATARAAGIETDSMVAESKFNSILDNQILPLLKQTFGAAFTAEEGRRLRDTIEGKGGPRAKIETINAFINQKVKDIQAKKLELDKLRSERASLISPEPANATQAAPQGQKRLRFNPQTGDFE